MMKTIKKILATQLILTSVSLSISACSNTGKSHNSDEFVFKTDPPAKELTQYNEVPDHLVLIYDGGMHRDITWDKEHFAPYVSTEIEGQEQWVFDGFLFLEIKDGQGRGFASGYEQLPARKTEWEKLLNNYYTEGNAIHALNAQIGLTRKEKKLPGEFKKRKVILGVPEPIPNQLDWGVADGRSLHFTNTEDRLVAIKWYVDYAEELFQKGNFEHVELAGFYWLAEEATNSRDLARKVSDYIYSKKYDFYWIPYFNSDGYPEWEALGFNVTYYQPNYFFSESVPYERLQEAYNRAEKLRMNLEVEFDERALKNNMDWGYRLTDYLDVFEQNGAFDSLKIAYYQGGDAFYQLSISKEPADIKLHQRLIQIIMRSKK